MLFLCLKRWEKCYKRVARANHSILCTSCLKLFSLWKQFYTITLKTANNNTLMYLFFLHTWLRCAFICLRSRYFATLAMCSTCLPILCQCMSRWCFCSILPHSMRLISKSTSTRGVNRQMMTFWDITSAFLPKKLNRLKKRKFQDWTYINHCIEMLHWRDLKIVNVKNTSIWLSTGF